MASISSVITGGFGTPGSASLVITDGFGTGATAPPVVQSSATGSDGYALTYSQYKRLLDRLKRRRKKLTEEEVSLVEQAYEELPEERREAIAEQAAPVFKDEDRKRIDAQMSARKVEAVRAIVAEWQRYQQDREDEELVLLTL